MSSLSASALVTALNTFIKNALSDLVASSAENSTCMPCFFAYSTALTAFSKTCWGVNFSLYCMWMSEVAMNVWTYFKSHFIAASMSVSVARARPHTSAFKPCFAIALMACISPCDTIGKPASIASIPSSSSLIATCTFCSGVMVTPGVCSPSLRVVSKILTLLWPLLFVVDDDFFAVAFKFPRLLGVLKRLSLPAVQFHNAQRDS